MRRAAAATYWLCSTTKRQHWTGDAEGFARGVGEPGQIEQADDFEDLAGGVEGDDVGAAGNGRLAGSGEFPGPAEAVVVFIDVADAGEAPGDDLGSGLGIVGGTRPSMTSEVIAVNTSAVTVWA